MVALVGYHMQHRGHVLCPSVIEGCRTRADEKPPESHAIPGEEKDDEQQHTQRGQRPCLQHDQIVVGYRVAQRASLAFNEEAVVVVRVSLVDLALVVGYLYVVRRDEDNQHQVEEDEDEQPQIQRHQLHKLLDRDEDDANPDDCCDEERHAKKQRSADRNKPEGKTPCIIIFVCYETAVGAKNFVRMQQDGRIARTLTRCLQEQI